MTGRLPSHSSVGTRSSALNIGPSGADGAAPLTGVEGVDGLPEPACADCVTDVSLPWPPPAAHAEHKSTVARLAQRRRSLERERRGREIMAQVPERNRIALYL